MPFNMPVKKSITKARARGKVLNNQARSAVKGSAPKPRMKNSTSNAAMEINAPPTEHSFKLCLKTLSGGGETVEMHNSIEDACASAWSWGLRNGLSVCSSDWDVVHPEFGWQDAYYAMIQNEDFMGLHLEMEELRQCFAKFFVECMNSAAGKFEAKGEGTGIASNYNGIACYNTVRAQPFWPR